MPVRTPRLKIVRRLGTDLPGLTRKDRNRRPHPPGAHGANARRRRPSAYRQRLEEKQKVRFNYGITERQMRAFMDLARMLPGETGVNLLTSLERRLDNVVFRLGLAPTIPAARQLVSHGHIAVNGARVDRPAYLVRVGDAVALHETARQRPALAAVVGQEPVLRLPSYLARDAETFGGRVIASPVRGDVPFPVREALIVEHYAR